MKDEEGATEEQKENGYSPVGSSPAGDTVGSSSFNDCSNPQSPSSVSYQPGCAHRGNDFQVPIDMASSQMRQFPPIFGTIAVDPGSSYAGRSFSGSREPYDGTDQSLPTDSRHGLLNSAYSQGMTWYPAGPPAYM